MSKCGDKVEAESNLVAANAANQLSGFSHRRARGASSEMAEGSRFEVTRLLRPAHPWPALSSPRSETHAVHKDKRNR